MQQVSLEEAKNQLDNLVESAMNGEEVLIAKDNQHAVKLVPVTTHKNRPQFGSARGVILFMSDDFDEPLEDFKEYME